MNDLVTRTLSGVLFVGLIVTAILLGQWYFASVFLIISVFGLLEFYKLAKINGLFVQRLIGVVISISIFLIIYFWLSSSIDQKWFLLIIPLIFFVFILELYRKKEKPFDNIAFTFLGLLYISIPFSLLSGLVFRDNTSDYTPTILLIYFSLIWLYDSAAYIFGVSFGKHRLLERISPKKSWEGFIGGAVFTLLAAYIISIYFTELTIVNWLVIAVIIIVAGTFGDLSESMFKRSIGVKDSGNILPGHGGILDRFDAVFLSSPLVFTYLQLL